MRIDLNKYFAFVVYDNNRLKIEQLDTIISYLDTILYSDLEQHHDNKAKII